MDQQVASQPDPRSQGKALSGAKLGSYWRIGHRKQIYRQV
jgi:hypothetical protein